MRIENDIKLDFDDVLLCPRRSEVGSRSQVDITRKFTTLYSKQEWKGTPIIAANLDTTGSFAMVEALHKFKMLTCLHKFYTEKQLVDFFNNSPASDSAFYTLGVTDKDINKLTTVLKYTNKITKITVDIANGYSKFFSEKVRQIRELCPNMMLFAGNVCTPELIQELVITGHADVVKVGIGPGAFCETRTVTGVGFPQWSAIVSCADAAHGLNAMICSDGGCRSSGDVSKSLAGGADFCMLGNLFSGTDPCEGEWEYEAGLRKSLKVYGMSSRESMEKYSGGVADYRASEGSCMQVPYKGPVEGVVQQLLGGLRSACAYSGATRLKDLSKCALFIKVNRVK